MFPPPIFFLCFLGTGVFPLEEAAAAVECARQKEALKVQIVCSQAVGTGE